MSESKHAPGPWYWSRTYQMGREAFHWCLHNEESEAEGKTIDAALILLLTEESFCGVPFLENPNARLIAKSPEMFAVLQEITPDTCPIITHHKPDCVLCRAIKLIAEIKGES